MMKKIMCSQRGNMYLFENATIFVGNKSVQVKHSEKIKPENIPIENTISILCGAGTSVTTSAKIELSKAKVPIGCIGSTTGKFHGGTEIVFDNPSSINQGNKYARGWIINTLDSEKRIQMAKTLLKKRLFLAKKYWDKDVFSNLSTNGFIIEQDDFPFKKWETGIDSHNSIKSLLRFEGEMMCEFYKKLGDLFSCEWIKRDPFGKDSVNRNITLGNSVSYGFSESVSWTLGIPLSFPVIHGDTNCSGVSYDIADLIKMPIVIPMAFAYSDFHTRTFTDELIELIIDKNILADMFEIVEEMAVT